MAACKGRLESENLIEEVDEGDILPMFSLTDFQDVNLVKPLCVPVLLDKVSTQIELDTGAGVSCLPDAFYRKCLKHVERTTVKLKTY